MCDFSILDLKQYITIKEASEQWGISTRAVTYHVVDGRIPGVIKRGGVWFIPSSTPKPEDLRKHNRRQSGRMGEQLAKQATSPKKESGHE